jgi:alpha-galactosidase
MRRTGYFVTESSEHQSEYVPYFIHHGQEIIDQFDIPIDEYLRRCKAIISTWEESEKQLLGDNGEIEINQQSHEYGSYIIHSLETNTLRTVYGNVPNHGIIENLPDPCCVEVPCQVDATGLSPVKIGSLPPQLAAMCMSNINVQELTVQAALTGKREHIYHAAMIDPHTAATLTLDKIWALCDELIEAHQNHGFLGEYSPVVKNTGRSAAEIGKKQIIRLIDFGFKNKQGEQTDLEFKVEGDLREFFPEDKLFISTDSKEITLSRDTISLQQLKNGDRITAVANSNIDQPIKIKIRSEHSEVLCVGTTLQPRTKIQGSLGKNPEFKLDLSGFECAHGELSRSENALTISMKVNDSNIKEAAKDSPWQGSCIEFYFSSTYNPNSIKKITIQPSEEGDFTAFEQIRTISNKVKIESIKRTKMYYCCDIIIPLECLDMNITEDSLLMNCAVRVNALGDAHSGGRNSLDGNVSANQITGNFIQVCF